MTDPQYWTIGRKESESIDPSHVSGRTVRRATISLVAHCESYKRRWIFRWRISSLQVPTYIPRLSETFKCLTSIPLVFLVVPVYFRPFVTPTIVPSLVARGELNLTHINLNCTYLCISLCWTMPSCIWSTGLLVHSYDKKVSSSHFLILIY